MKSVINICLIIITSTLISCTICNKDDILINNGILIWTGEYEVDGCGFFISIDGYIYKPENESIINDDYKISREIIVKVEYNILNYNIESWCGDSPYKTITEGIRIVSIEKI